MSSSVEQAINADNGSGVKLNITQASEYLDTSRNTTWRVIKRHRIKTFENPMDLRETLVLKEDLDQIRTLLRPKPRKSKRRVSNGG